MWFISLLVLIFILGIIILVHEFGHFIWAKTFKVHIYEFSIGMGPVIFTHKGKKDKIDYNLRAIPIGGFVSMAGEVYEDDEKINKKSFMCNKPWWQRLIILVAGVVNNFILALLLLFLGALIWGATINLPEVKEVVEGSAMDEAGIVAGDEILAINGRKVSNWDTASILLIMESEDNVYTFNIRHEDGTVEDIDVTPTITENENGTKTNTFGVYIKSEEVHGFVDSLKYAFQKFGSIVHSMALTIEGLFTGKISLQALSGPVGMYEVVDQSIGYGISYMLYLVAFLSINVGFINILPFPAFDGGRVLFLIIEQLKGSPVNSKVENICHMIGFFLLILLMIYITIQDIFRFF